MTIDDIVSNGQTKSWFGKAWGYVMNPFVGTFRDLVGVGGRQFFLCNCLMIVASLLFVFDKLDQGGFMALMVGGVVAYITSNQVENYVAKKAEAAQNAQAAP